MSPPRNDPCPCGSGANYKHCCLDREAELARLVPEMETIVAALSGDTLNREQEWYHARFAEFYDGGIEAFGSEGPSPEERFEAGLWFLLDCPMDNGETPLHRFAQIETGRAIALLARSELRAWRIEAVGGTGLAESHAARGIQLTALCPLGTGRARLEAVRQPVGRLCPGAVLVARSAPLGPQRWALLGRPAMVELETAAEFERLLASLEAPAGEFWSVHGGVLARAAWAWPEERMVTLEGDTVADSLVRYGLTDATATVAELDAEPEFEGAEAGIDGALRWRWRWQPPRIQTIEPAWGVRSELCPEDAEHPPHLALVVVDQGELWLHAPTPARLGLAEALLLDRYPQHVRGPGRRCVEPPQITPRWQRLRAERLALRRAA